MMATALASTSESQRSSLWPALIIASLFFVPAALGYYFEAVSFASGTALVSFIVLALAAGGYLAFRARDIRFALQVSLSACIIVAVHLLVSYVINSDPLFDISRALLSLVLFGLVLFSIPVISDVTMISAPQLFGSLLAICGVFVVIAVFSILQIQPDNFNLGEKPTFPYTEPSFYGFSFPAVLVFVMARSRLVIRVFLLIVFLIVGFLLSNLTIIVSCGLAALVTLPLTWIIASVTTFLVGETTLDLTYYTDRINFDWANSNNLSSLVYVQGWQMLQEAIDKTYGWGLGFQQLGIGYTYVPASMRINVLLGRDANLQDGGFILSKLGGEFGVLGLVVALGYLYVAFQSVIKTRQMIFKGLDMPDGQLLARSCVIGYIIELLVRGSSYFTGTFVLMLAGMLCLYKTHYGYDSNRRLDN